MIKQLKIAGMVWFRLEDYDAAVGLMEDREQFPSSYSIWRIKAEQSEKQMRRLGWTTIRAYINPSEFVAWCRGKGLSVDAKGRNEFATLIAKEASSGAH